MIRNLVRVANCFQSIGGRRLAQSPFVVSSPRRSLHNESGDLEEKLLNLETVKCNDSDDEFQGVPLMRRALLYCPGSDQHKINKVMSISDTVDCIVLDCEDGVAINKKVRDIMLFLNSRLILILLQNKQEEARVTIVDHLNRLYLANRNEQLERLSVRINSVQSGLAEQDLRTILSGYVVPRTLLLPKVDSKEDIDWV